MLIAWVSFLLGDGPSERKLLIAAVATLWGLRLAIYITIRNHGKGEDYRYVAMREKHGARFPVVSLYTVFAFQAVMCWIIALPLQISQFSVAPAGLPALIFVGAAISLFGITFEAVADAQLKRFKTDPENKGGVMDQGLWRYSRHPNYFGEAVVWWGFWVACLSVEWGFLTVISPLLITWLLMRFSGVPLLEAKMATTRAGYKEYMERTSAFVPLPPRSRSHKPSG